MKINDEVMHFRKERARELEMVGEALDKEIKHGLSYDLKNAINQLKTRDTVLPLKDGTVDKNTWGYEINNFNFSAEPPRHVRPLSIRELNISLDMKMIANIDDWDKMNDPLKELSFRVTIRGIGEKEYYNGFHIDKHHKETLEGEEVHPVYHLQYMPNPNSDSYFDYGSVLDIDTPRVMHYPMDFVLGVGFLTANFFPYAYASLIKNHFFYRIFTDYQYRIWKPYSHTLASFWKPFDERILTWDPKLLCPYLLD